MSKFIMRLVITFHTLFLFATILTLQPKILLILEGTEETNFVFARESPSFNEYHHLIVCILKRRQQIGKIQHDHYETFLVYLVILLLTNGNDIHLNPGPRAEREYLCGTCDKTVNWEERGVICETCDQWYHAGCQNIHTLSYDQLGDSELNISWHCIICNNPNYSYAVNDYQSIEIASSLSNSNILDLPPQSPDRTNIKPLHSSTPTRMAGPPKCASPLKIVNINFQSIKSKLCRLSNVIESIKPISS